jgi:CHAT domain-containing protein/Tfp pilus assembly protein PilF
MKKVQIVAALLIGFFLPVQHSSLAQSAKDASRLNSRATELLNGGRYSEAEPLYKRALAIREKVLGPDHPDVATSLNNLAALYYIEERYADVELLYERSLAIREKALGPDHPNVAISLSNLAELYRVQGRYADAEPLHKRSLAIMEKRLGPDHPDVAISLNNLAALYKAQGRYADAEPLHKRSLAILEKRLGPDHPNVAILLTNLAALYKAQGRYADAEPLYRRSLAIQEKALGPNDPIVATSLNNLAALYKAQGRYADAEQLYRRSLAIREKALGPDHPDVAITLGNLAVVYFDQGRYAKAEQLYKRELTITEKAHGPDNPRFATLLNNLAALYYVEERYADAEPLYKRSLAIREKALGPGHPDVASSLGNLANIYHDQGRYADAEPLYKRSLAINEKALGPDDLAVATSLNNLAELYSAQGRYAQAEPIYNRSLAITEKALGPNHPDVGTHLNNLAGLYLTQGRYAEAEPLYKRALAIKEKALGPDHPAVAISLNFLAELYKVQGRYADALPIVQRTIAQKHSGKWVALNVIYASQSQNLIAPTQALNLSYTVLQNSLSSAAGEAISKLAARFAAGPDALAQLVRKDQDLRAEAERLDKSIITAVSKPPAERNTRVEEQIRKHIDEIRSESDKLQDVLYQRFPGYAAISKPQPLTVEQIQALLAEDEALVTVDLGENSDLGKNSYVWVITKNGAEWKEISVSAEDVSKAVVTLRGALDPNSPKSFDSSVAYQLYQQLFGPIEKIISQKSRLSFVLDGALTSLPLQVLIITDPDGKDLASVNWLIRKYATTVLPSVASLKTLREQNAVVAAAEPMIGFGDPIFDRTAQTGAPQRVAALNRSLPSFYRGTTADTKALGEALPPLPETADELRAIAKALGAKSEDIKLGESASVTNVKHERLDNYRVVYFATHALVAGEVEKFAKVKAEPALVLTIPDKPSEEDDGLLRASDVAMLKMNADFVVLSACNTAAGDKPGAEALSGLARAFFYAGAKSLVVSHWEVDSDSTVELMDGLFEALKENPHLSHAEALRTSMLRMIGNSSKPEWSQPKFWAPFIVVGEPQKQ